MFQFYRLRNYSVALLITLLAWSQPALSNSLSNQMDIRVLIDVSGSMKKTDPKNLRIPALQVLTQLLPEGSQAGVWEFANTPKMIVPLGQVSAAWQEQALIAAQNISSTGQLTDIGAALNAVAFNAQDQTQGRQLHVILLTDGMVDVSKNAADNKLARAKLLEPILQQYINVGARVHTVGLSYEADQSTLRALAQRTDGLFEVALNADQLLDIFLRALDNTVVSQQVTVEAVEQSFIVEEGIELITIVVEKNGDENIQFKDGNNTRFNRADKSAYSQWQNTVSHDVVRIKNPVPGTWSLISDTAKLTRINVVGKFQILLQQSHQNIKVGQPSFIDVQLADANGAALNASQLQGFKLSVSLDDGAQQVFKQQRVFARNQKTRVDLPPLTKEGLHTLTIAVENGPIARTITRSMRVHPLVLDEALPTSKNLQLPVAQELEVIIEPAAKVSQPVIEVSNEKPSAALQALMLEANPEAKPEARQEAKQEAKPEEPVVPAETHAKPVEKRVSLVNQPAQPVQQETPPKTPQVQTTEQTVEPVAEQPLVDDTEPSLYWRWYVVGFAALVLVVLLIGSRRKKQ